MRKRVVREYYTLRDARVMEILRIYYDEIWQPNIYSIRLLNTDIIPLRYKK